MGKTVSGEVKMDRLYKLKCWIYPLSFLGAEMFSAFCGITGYRQEEGSALYLYYMISLFALSLLLVVHDIFILGKPFSKMVLLIPIIFTACYFSDISSESPPLEWTKKAYQFFLFFSLSPMLIASLIAKNNSIEGMYKYLDVILIILGIGMIARLPKMMMLGELIEGYNGISYQSALAFGAIYYGLLSKREDRFKFLKNKVFKLVSIVMCVLLPLTCLSSGGRGGVVFLFALAGLISLIFVKKRNIFRVLFFVLPLGLLGVVIIFDLVQNSVLENTFNRGMDRAFSYISSSGIDMAQTSNRDIVFELAQKNIEANRYTGYGIFHTIGAFGYPHNIFLEILEGGGIFYFAFWIIILIISIKRAYFIIKIERNLLFLVPLFIYPFVNLLFSGSYLMTGMFWFVLVFVLIYKPQQY